MPGIYKGSTPLSSLKIGSANVAAVYYGATQIWPVVTGLVEGTPAVGVQKTSGFTWSLATGAAAGNRRLIVMVEGRASNILGLGAPTVTVDGSPATLAVQADSGMSTHSIFSIALPSGTTSTIAVNFAGAMAWGRVIVHPLYGLTQNTPYGTGWDKNMDNRTLEVSGFGGGFATVIASVTDPSAATWSNATGRFTASPGDYTVSYGAGRLRADSPVTVRFGSASNDANALMVGAVWR